ncbi:LAMTOR1/MEH1 family protein [Aspergillus glaucus CBS 516.65]|uniref:Ragulator complex protein LAMTOR1 n=1 Tax=Aspergillus glaucus CBS 516.65 TaxID=1160497 RepID=A0A1L9VQL3_ASPGL|nr:hypothetical protein ASPGLDRAFT_45225 [Aspergillus glaucus CBS 516.65]OJJ86180.1 hypothetical protein ASPGLDRAFT_45225 [Aspergillus glaucus CBS 516.65]
MGICASCLGQGRRDHNDYESTRLLDDDIYQSGYGYGALNHANQTNHPDPESIKREREALEAICQRTSESVIDIWSLQPQPHLQPRATLPRSNSGSREGTADDPPVVVTAPSTASSNTASDNGTGTVPKHWGEVVINPRKDRGAKAGGKNGRDVFGVLQVS